MENGQTIKEFIKEHGEQLSAMGVLAGLAALVGTLAVNWIGYILSFLMLSCLALIWSEINLKHKEEFPTRLGVFKLFLRIGYFLLVLYILLTHRIISWFFLAFPIALFLLLIFMRIINKFAGIKIFLRKYKFISVLIATIVSGVIVLISYSFANPINVLLDAIARFNSIK